MVQCQRVVTHIDPPDVSVPSTVSDLSDLPVAAVVDVDGEQTHVIVFKSATITKSAARSLIFLWVCKEWVNSPKGFNNALNAFVNRNAIWLTDPTKLNDVYGAINALYLGCQDIHSAHDVLNAFWD